MQTSHKHQPLRKGGIAQAYKALERYCARRERAPSEVRRQIAQWELSETEARALWEHLRRERFVDEQRYARAFAADKLRLEGWGRLRIRQALRQKGIAPHIIEQTLSALDPEEYMTVLHRVAQQKRRQYANHPHARQKVQAALLRAGFEPEFIEMLDKSET
ncbi:MAG: RecX family transcriptional regulator [Saprospiraceae bacterium]|nr:RecX family transcriptional regulator [Saprospiraceae bacterium]MDW8484365.1 regulatory protein RecX [Saprospiraceae bacterium]